MYIRIYNGFDEVYSGDMNTRESTVALLEYVKAHVKDPLRIAVWVNNTLTNIYTTESFIKLLYTCYFEVMIYG